MQRAPLALALVVCAAGCGQRAVDILPDAGVGDAGPPLFTTLQAPGADFFAVAGSGPDNVIAVGSGGTIVRWNGATLAVEPSGTSVDLRGVAVVSKKDAWAVGAQGTVLRWDGTRWSLQPVMSVINPPPDGGPVNAAADGGAFQPGLVFNAVAANPKGMVAVGARGLALGFDGMTFFPITTDSPDDLYSLANTPQGLIAVGSLGTVARFDGNTAFHRSAIPGYAKTLGGATSGPGGSWLVGLGGALYRYDGNFNARMGLPPVFLRGVAAPGKNLWVVGFDATIARVRGMEVQLYTDVPNRWYEGVWAAADDDVWVVGTSGAVLHAAPPVVPDGGVDAGPVRDGGGRG